jgi:hypothetical protein
LHKHVNLPFNQVRWLTLVGLVGFPTGLRESEACIWRIKEGTHVAR